MNFPIRYRVYLPVIGAIGLATCILRSIACLTVRTPDGYFPSSVLPDISVWMLLALSLFALTYPIFNRSLPVRPILLTNPIHIVPSGLLAFAQVFLSVDLLSRLSQKPSSAIGQAILLLTALCGLFGAIYFVLCLCIKGDASASRAWFGMAAILFGALYAVYLYFDTTAPLNSDCKITSQVVYLCTSVYLLFDVRLSLGRARYSMQISVGFITAALCAYAAIPAMITYIAKGTLIDHSIFETVYSLLFFFFVCARLYGLSRLPKEEVCIFAQAALDQQKAVTSASESSDTSVNQQEEEISAPPLFENNEPLFEQQAEDNASYTTFFENDEGMPLPQESDQKVQDNVSAHMTTEEDE